MDPESLVPHAPGNPNDIAAQINASLCLTSPDEGSVEKGEGEGEGAEKEQRRSNEGAKKDAKKAAQRQQQARSDASEAGGSESNEEDPLSSNYGDLLEEVDIESKYIPGRIWTDVGKLCAKMKGESVWISGVAQVIRPVSKKMAFLVVRRRMSTVQCVLVVAKDLVSPQMVRFATSLTKKSHVRVEGIISVPNEPIKDTTQQVEIQVRKLYCTSRALPNLPFDNEDASRSETEFKKAEETWLDRPTPTPADHAIFLIRNEVEDLFRQFLWSQGFLGDGMVPRSSVGAAAAFNLDYKGKPGRSPQLHMAINGGFNSVFEVGPVIRFKDSNTDRYLCEFLIDAEMEIWEHYFEVCDIVDSMFMAMFDHLHKNFTKELETINLEYPFQPLKYLPKTLRLTYDEGIQMLKEAGVEVEPMGDLNTEAEKKLGELVSDKYNTDFYILTRYPSRVRPFYTMPCHDNPAYSNSFDVFIRGEEIISGAQRIHHAELLTNRAKECGIDVNTISTYIDSFRYDAPPCGGFQVMGVERVVMLFCGLKSCRFTSLFPRYPKWLLP